MNRLLRWKMIVTFVVTAVISVSVLYPFVADRTGWSTPSFLLRNRLALGLDLKGGVQLVLQVHADEALATNGQTNRDEIVAETRETIDRRINELGVAEISTAIQGDRRDQIVVQLPGYTDLARARSVLGTTARLEWRLVEAGPSTTRDALKTNGVEPDGTEILPTSTAPGTTDAPAYYLVQRTAGIAGADIRSAKAIRDQNGQPAIQFSLTPDGGRRFAALTSASVGRQLAIVLDEHVRSAPRIDNAIAAGDGTIEGRFSSREAADLALVLRSGALPASMTYLGGQYVGPTLGAQAIWAGVGASAAGLLIVAAFMLLYYNRAGINAVVSLAVNMLMLLGAMAWLGAAMTLPGIAGVILTIGMGVDSNVLIFERIKEELHAGRSARAAVAAGFDRVFLTILDTHVTSLVTAAFLFQFGTGPIRGFATTLAIGLLANVFTAVFVSRTLFDVALSRRGAPVLKLATFARSTTAAPSIDFLAWRRYTLPLSALVIAASIVIAFARGGLPLGLDFTGGTAIVARFGTPVTEDMVRNAIPGDATVQRYGGPSDREFLIRLAQLPSGPTDADLEAGVHTVTAALGAAHVSDVEIVGTETVGPTVGADLERKGAMATVASLAGMGAYVAWRFRPAFAAGAILATVHDIVITVAVLRLCGYDLTLNTVAAVLTVAGYSVNDTIVVFDRARETLRAAGRYSIDVALNAAVNQTLGRTMITGSTTFLAVLALWLFGGHVLHGFALAMLVGIVAGKYSTVFLAAPIAARLTRSW